ncbi:hypothetical protein Golob_021576, partial [Gossypium lobatum]|nr:hypothetical protein [Gossypium lobatum]
MSLNLLKKILKILIIQPGNLEIFQLHLEQISLGVGMKEDSSVHLLVFLLVSSPELFLSVSFPLQRKLFDSFFEQNLEFSPPKVHGGSVIVKPPAEKLVNMLWSKQGVIEVNMVYVEISVDFEFPRFINIELSDGSFVSIRVEVPWLSMRCLKCRSFSHSGKHCSKKNESAPDGGGTLPSTFEGSSKGKAMVMDLSFTLKPTYVFLTGYSNRFEVLSVELEDSNDAVDDDIDAEQIKGFNDIVDDDNETKQLEFSPWKPTLASLAVGLFMRSLMTTKQENLDKGKKKTNSYLVKGRGKVGGKG